MDHDHRRHTPTDPSVWLVLVAGLSVVLPIIGVLACAAGVVLFVGGDASGIVVIAAGIACIVLDILIDFVWASPALQPKADAMLNHPEAGLIGHVVTVIESIANGRGKVQVADTVWLAEGPDAAAGTRVRIIAARDVVLIVEPEITG